MKHTVATVAVLPAKDGASVNADLLMNLRETEREVRRLKDYIYGLKIMLAFMMLFMTCWFAVDVVFRAVNWLKS